MSETFTNSTEALRAVYSAYANSVRAALDDGDPDDALIYAESMCRMEREHPDALDPQPTPEAP